MGKEGTRLLSRTFPWHLSGTYPERLSPSWCLYTCQAPIRLHCMHDMRELRLTCLKRTTCFAACRLKRHSVRRARGIGIVLSAKGG